MIWESFCRYWFVSCSRAYGKSEQDDFKALHYEAGLRSALEMPTPLLL
jgi:hypothetical protein